MKFFKKDNMQENNEPKNEITTEEKMDEVNDPPVEDEWIWVEGYKGTDKNMCCRDHQYEIGKQYDMPDDKEIKECSSGFHLCLLKEHVFNYYEIGRHNRFFKVKALVRKADADTYGTYEYHRYGCTYKDKLASKSIVLLSELTVDEILKDRPINELPNKYKNIAIEVDENAAYKNYHTDTLIQDGYSETFALYIVSQKKYEIAHAVGTQKDLSMDMKVMTIFNTEQ